MSADVVTVTGEATLREAAGRLLERDVGSVVVLDDGTPAGFLTDTDVLRAVYRRETTLDAVPVAAVAHPVPFTADPDSSVSLLAGRMAESGVKRVPVVADLDLVGVITLTDIAWHLSDLRREAIEAGRPPAEWTAD